MKYKITMVMLLSCSLSGHNYSSAIAQEAGVSSGKTAAAESGLSKKLSATDKPRVSSEREIYQDWFDKSRNRSVPVKIYLPNSSHGPAPLLIFSHGLGGSREAAEYLGEYLSNNGYICVHIQHPGSDISLFKGALAAGREGIMSKMQAAANGENLIARVGDVRFVLDELERRNQSDPVLKSRIDMNKIAVSGHSFGAGTALAIAGQNYNVSGKSSSFADPRVKAAIYYSPPVNLRGRSPQEVFGSIQIPGLLMTGTDDSSPIGGTSAEERLIPFDGFKPGDKYLVNFAGGDHMIFSGRSKPGRQESDERYHQMINRVSKAFLDAYLKGDSKEKTWLKSACANYLAKAAEFKTK